MAKAPSEKHLEDWIVANPDVLTFYEGLPVQIIGRQVNLPSGRADIIARCGINLLVVELKKGEVDQATVVQVMRYMHDLKHIWYMATEYLPSGFSERGHTNEILVTGVVVGCAVAENTVKSAESVDITVLTYDFDGETYVFEQVLPDYMSMQTAEEYALGILGVTMRQIYAERLQDLDPAVDTSNLEQYWRGIVTHE